MFYLPAKYTARDVTQSTAKYPLKNVAHVTPFNVGSKMEFLCTHVCHKSHDLWGFPAICRKNGIPLKYHVTYVLKWMMSPNAHFKFCLWALIFAINMSVAICQLPICQIPSFGKMSIAFDQSDGKWERPWGNLFFS